MIVLLLALACSREPPPDPCDLAWAELSALRDGLWTRYGAVIVAPDEATFRATCEALPPERRACFAPTWASEHPECAGIALR